MARLVLSLLGPPVMSLDGQRVANLTAKMQALLAYLAVEADRPHRREVLAGLFWGEQPERAAYNNLRQALHRLQLQVHDIAVPFLLTTPQTVQFNSAADHSLDVAEFTALISGCNRHPHRQRATCRVCVQSLQSAADLYRGALLAGLPLKDAPAFEEWLLVKRDRLERLALSALYDLTEYHARRGEYAAMEQIARRQIEIDVFREDAHRQLMNALTWRGECNSALAHYEVLRRQLAQELGVAPEPDTTRLRAQIEAMEGTPPLIPLRHGFPVLLSPFFGRERELAQIAGYLQNPEVRLISIVAPGGTGKTRLALQAAEQEAFTFREGTCFVPLTGATESSFIVHAIGEALGFAFSGASDPKQQLLVHLRRQEMVLVLDGLEQFVGRASDGQGLEILSELLHACPGVAILATSRVPLDLAEEWTLPLSGLPVPEDATITMLEMNSAVQLFAHRARQVDPGFSLEAHGRELVRICKLVEGMPLALELAAVWVQVMSCGQIASEIESNLGFLSTSLRNLPERHRSLPAVFEGSYNLLSAVERKALCGLSVFRGGFTREAAERVAGVDVALLASLVHKALVRANSSGRYDMHELLRQFAQAKLGEQPEEQTRTQSAYCHYYLSGFMPELEQDLWGGRQNEAFTKFGQEFLNILAAWHWAAQHAYAEEIVRSYTTLAFLCDFVGYFHEAEQAYGQAMKGLEEKGDDLAFGTMVAGHGFFSIRLGLYDQARRDLEKSREILNPSRYGERLEVALPSYCLGVLAYHQGDLTRARDQFLAGLAIFRKSRDQFWARLTTDYLGEVHRVLEDFQAAQEYLQEGLVLHRQAHDQWGTAQALVGLGSVLICLGKYVEAKRVLQESLELFQTLRLTFGIALASNGLGRAYCGLGQYRESHEHLRAALKTAAEIEAAPLLFDVLIGLAELVAAEGGGERAAELAVYCGRHPASQKETRGRADRLLATLGKMLPPEALTAACLRGEKLDLEQCLKELDITKGESSFFKV